jgi:branched-chain amino acid transport system substrate-binding protein
LLLPGVSVSTSPTDYLPFKQVQMMRFDGKRWVLFGEVLAQSGSGSDRKHGAGLDLELRKAR